MGNTLGTDDSIACLAHTELHNGVQVGDNVDVGPGIWYGPGQVGVG